MGLRLKRWNREEVDLLEKNGFLDGQRYEGWRGTINKMGQNEWDVFAIPILNVLLVGMFGRGVRIQLPIDVSPEDNPANLSPTLL